MRDREADEKRDLAALCEQLSAACAALPGADSERPHLLTEIARLTQAIAERSGAAVAPPTVVAPVVAVARNVMAANRFLDAIIENIPHMIFVKDAENLAFERFNKAGEELLGVAREHLIGKNDYDFFPPKQAEFFQEKDRKVLRGKALLDITEEPIDTKHGPRWLHTKKVPILDEVGEPAYLLGISEDITERKAAQERLLDAIRAAENANHELEAFSYSVAHDLRAPLRAIDGFSQALLEDHGDKLDAEGKDFLTRMRGSAQQMAQLIDDLLSLSRVTRSELKRERVSLNAIASSIIARLKYENPERSVQVVIEPDLVVDADARLLAVVLENLLSNAWKFTSKTPDARIDVGCEARPGLPPVLFVRDNGAGFDTAYSKKLFGVFQRLHTVNEFPGTGIGLATVQRIIARHGGKISARGEVGAGAVFHFTFEKEPTP